MVQAQDVPVSLETLGDKNLMQLAELNRAIFSDEHDDYYYDDALSSGDFTKLAYYGDTCVGCIACCIEWNNANVVRLYIMTLGVLAPYRGLGIGSKLMKHVLDLCRQDAAILDISLHVQTNNAAALAFYQNFGFEILEKIEKYYTDIKPPADGYLLVKSLRPCSSS